MRHDHLVIQFGDYQWGSSKDSIEDMLLKKGLDFIKSKRFPNTIGIIYKDTIMGEEFDVHLRFTLRSRKLYEVVLSIVSVSSYKIVQKIQKVLVTKYGFPAKSKWLSEDCITFQIWDLGKYEIQTAIHFQPDSFYSFNVVYRSRYYYTICKLEELKGKKYITADVDRL